VGKGLKIKNKTQHTDEKEKKSNSDKSRARVLTVEELRAWQQSYKASSDSHGTAAQKKCRNDGARSLPLPSLRKKYP